MPISGAETVLAPSRWKGTHAAKAYWKREWKQGLWQVHACISLRCGS